MSRNPRQEGVEKSKKATRKLALDESFLSRTAARAQPSRADRHFPQCLRMLLIQNKIQWKIKVQMIFRLFLGMRMMIIPIPLKLWGKMRYNLPQILQTLRKIRMKVKKSLKINLQDLHQLLVPRLVDRELVDSLLHW